MQWKCDLSICRLHIKWMEKGWSKWCIEPFNPAGGAVAPPYMYALYKAIQCQEVSVWMCHSDEFKLVCYLMKTKESCAILLNMSLLKRRKWSNSVKEGSSQSCMHTGWTWTQHLTVCTQSQLSNCQLPHGHKCFVTFTCERHTHPLRGGGWGGGSQRLMISLASACNFHPEPQRDAE